MMSSKAEEHQGTYADGDTKADVLHDDDVKKEVGEVQGDYSGAAAKSDPAEIALVRKLDFRIMVRDLLLTYRLGY